MHLEDTGGRRLFRWATTALFILIGVGLGIELLRLVPSWVERHVRKTLLAEGVVITTFPVEEVGPARVVVGTGGLVADPVSMQWSALSAEFGLRGLMAGHVSRLLLENTDLTVRLPPVPPPPPAGRQSLWARLQALPMDETVIPAGTLDVLVDEAFLFSTGFDARLQRQPFGMAGELSLADGWGTAYLSLRAPASEQLVTIQGEAAVEATVLQAWLAQLYGFKMLDILSASPVRAGMLLELPASGTSRTGLQVAVDAITLQLDGVPCELNLAALVAAGTIQDGIARIEGGLRVMPLQSENLSSGDFGLRFSYRPEDGLRFESEAVEFKLGAMAGRGALRGSASGGRARAEISLTAATVAGVSAEPFSVLLEKAGGHLHAALSPVGLVRAGTLWIEEARARWDLAARSGAAGFRWFDTAGREMGAVAVEAAADGGAVEARIGFSDTSGEAFLSGRLRRAAEGDSLELKGAARCAWINALNRWWPVLPARLSGADPLLEASLSGTFPLYQGSVRLVMDGLGLEFGDGLLLDGLHGDTRLLLDGLVRSDGAQLTGADRLQSGDFVLTDLHAEWRLHTIRQLEVLGFSATIGAGRLALDPFTIDPLEPRLATTLRIQGLPAGQLLEWLGERRFAIDGAVSGSLGLEYADGQIAIGQGLISLDAAGSSARFRFVDQGFLRERFAAFTGVPDDLRERFLGALLQDGIRIATLEAQLGSGPEQGQVLLRIAISGASRTDQLEVPIRGFVINNVISAEDLAELLGLLGDLRIRAAPILPASAPGG